MEFAKITKEEKLKMFDKMLSYVKKKAPENDDDLYDACRTAGFMFYEFLSEKEI